MLDRKVIVVSNNHETVDGVRDYLQRAGARASSVGKLQDAVAAAAGVDAIVFFADDYPRAEAIETFAKFKRHARAKVLVVVTDQVESFGTDGPGDKGASRVVVLRRPAWGWMLIDAVRDGAKTMVKEP